MNKKTILDKIYYNLGKQHTDFKIFSLFKIENETKSTKHKKYSEVCFSLDHEQSNYFLEKVNNRTICENEIVLDIESKEDLEKIKRKLSDPTINDCDIYIFDTQSRGIHIHMWYKNPVSDKIKKALIKIFDADEMKTTGKPIALEFVNHWKSKKEKKLIWERKNL